MKLFLFLLLPLSVWPAVPPALRLSGDVEPVRYELDLNLDPAKDAARVRAMYTHPLHTRKGVGRLILSLCEEAASAEGFKRVDLMATLSGEPLYRACGYEPIERVTDDRGGESVPLLRMTKPL